MAFEKIFGTAPLVRADGSSVEVASLKGNPVAIYFSAHWCGPCRSFTPQLIKFYNMMKATGRSFEVVFASSDRDQAGFDEYFGTMPWTAFPFGDARKAAASQKFKVQGIPTLVILDGTGKLITTDGRARVTEDPQGADFPWVPPTVEEVASSITYKAHDGTTRSWADLKKMDAVGFYFSAHWCGPCRAFTPQLIKTYNKLKADGKKFEVVFVSSDHDQASFDEYWGSMPWIAMPFGHDSKAKLDTVFPHRGIPTFYLVNPATGKIITENGRGKVMGDKEGANFPWLPQPCEQLGDGPDVNSAAVLCLLTDGAEDLDAANASVAALKAFAKTQKAEWDGKAEEDADYPFDFGYGDADCGIVAPIRNFTKLTKKAPVLFLLDVPSQSKAVWPGTGYPSASDIAAFAKSIVDGSVKRVGIKDPVA